MLLYLVCKSTSPICISAHLQNSKILYCLKETQRINLATLCIYLWTVSKVYLHYLMESQPPLCVFTVPKDNAALFNRVWIENVDEQFARVMFVDYGNTDSVPLSDLQVLPEIYWRVRPLAVPFRLLPQPATKGNFVMIFVDCCVCAV